MHWHVRIAGDPPQTYAMEEVDLARLDTVMPILAWCSQAAACVSLWACERSTCALSHADELPPVRRVGA